MKETRRGQKVNKAEKATIRVGHLTHPLSNFEIRIYYENESKFNSFYSRNDLPEIKDGEFVINLDEYKSIETL